MLYRKTTTAFSAVILGVMALLGVTAHAQLDLDQAGTTASPIAVITFSKESLPQLTGMETFYVVRVAAGSQNDFNVKTTLGYPIPANTPMLGGAAMRIDLRNLEFNVQLANNHLIIQPPGGPALDMSNVPRRLAYGGTGTPGTDMRCPGDTCAIFEIGNLQSGNAVLPDTTEFWLETWPGRLRIHPDGNGQARIRFFRNADAALNPALLGGRKDTGFKRIADVKSSVTTTITPGTPAVADVAATPKFTNFTPAGTRPLGGISIALATTHWRADGVRQVASLDDVRPATNGGSILITDTTDNLGFGTFTLQSSTACSDTQPAGVTVLAEGNNAGRGTAALFAGARTLCVAPRATSRTDRMAPNFEIPATSLTAAVSFVGLPNSAFPAPGMTGAVGSIVRNGATVQISYLTVSDRYNQRIIITNRGMVAAEYELSNFYTEDGTEGMAGDTGEGMVPGNSSVVVLTREAVTFTGNRARGSATLAVTAPASTISVATTQVNLSDGSTDTVNYEVMGAGAN